MTADDTTFEDATESEIEEVEGAGADEGEGEGGETEESLAKATASDRAKRQTALNETVQESVLGLQLDAVKAHFANTDTTPVSFNDFRSGWYILRVGEQRTMNVHFGEGGIDQTQWGRGSSIDDRELVVHTLTSA